MATRVPTTPAHEPPAAVRATGIVVLPTAVLALVAIAAVRQRRASAFLT